MKCAKTRDWEVLVNECKKGDILFFRSSGIVSRLIRFFSPNPPKNKKKYNHVEMVYAKSGSSVLIISARETAGGEVARALLRRYRFKKNDIKIMRPKYKPTSKRTNAVKFALSMDGKKYDYKAIGSKFAGWWKRKFKIKHKDSQNPDKWYCSELIGEALIKAGFDKSYSELSPTELNAMPGFKQVLYYEA